MLDLDAIRRDHPLPAVVGASVKLIRAGNEFKACCPFHSEKSPSFTIFGGGDRFYCFGCGASGDVLEYVGRAHGVGLRQAAHMLTGGDLPTVQLSPLPADDGGDRIEEARAIWEASTPAKGTLAESYLRSRGLHLSMPDSIRFARLRYGTRGPNHPCLVASVVTSDGAFSGIQRTYLALNGMGKAKVPKAKLSLGRVSGGAIRLTPPAGDLVVCEGLEDGLTLRQELGRAVWVAAGASLLPSMQFPPGVRSVAIGGDADDAGRAAAGKAAETYALRGLATRTFFPAPPHKDFNLQLQEGSRS